MDCGVWTVDKENNREWVQQECIRALFWANMTWTTQVLVKIGAYYSSSPLRNCFDIQSINPLYDLLFQAKLVPTSQGSIASCPRLSKGSVCGSRLIPAPYL